MSLAVNLTMKLAAVAAEALQDNAARRRRGDPRAAPPLQGGRAQRHGPEVRRDHRRRDGPDRGTCTAAQGRPASGPHDEIGYHAIRIGDNPGEHTIVFGMLGETIELTVRATNRDCYALGALAAAKFVARPTARPVRDEGRAGAVTSPGVRPGPVKTSRVFDSVLFPGHLALRERSGSKPSFFMVVRRILAENVGVLVIIGVCETPGSGY